MVSEQELREIYEEHEEDYIAVRKEEREILAKADSQSKLAQKLLQKVIILIMQLF